MKNINYDLLKLLHGKLDDVWRLEKFYLTDATKAKCHSVAALKKILADDRNHIQMLLEEIGTRMKKGIFN